jgi:hypothetical protein
MDALNEPFDIFIRTPGGWSESETMRVTLLTKVEEVKTRARYLTKNANNTVRLLKDGHELTDNSATLG